MGCLYQDLLKSRYKNETNPTPTPRLFCWHKKAAVPVTPEGCPTAPWSGRSLLSISNYRRHRRRTMLREKAAVPVCMASMPLFPDGCPTDLLGKSSLLPTPGTDDNSDTESDNSSKSEARKQKIHAIPESQGCLVMLCPGLSTTLSADCRW